MVESKDAWSVSRDCVMSELAIRGDIVCRAPDRARSPASYDLWPARARLIAAAPALLEAAQKVLAGLNERIDAAPLTAVPVFAGIADLHSAIALALSQEEVGSE